MLGQGTHFIEATVEEALRGDCEMGTFVEDVGGRQGREMAHMLSFERPSCHQLLARRDRMLRRNAHALMWRQ